VLGDCGKALQLCADAELGFRFHEKETTHSTDIHQ